MSLLCFASGIDETDLLDKDGLAWDDSDEVFGESSDLDREWQRRHDQFYTVIWNFEFVGFWVSLSWIRLIFICRMLDRIS